MSGLGNKEIMAKNIKYYMGINNIRPKDICDVLKFPMATFSDWIHAKSYPRIDKIEMMANYFGISKSDLVEDHKNIGIKQERKGTIIEVLGSVAAGIPISAVEDIIDEEEVTEDMARQGNLFGLRIKGHSMEPNICDGDTVIVKEQPDAENGETVVVLINGDEATCKKIYKYEDGSIRLVPNNPAFSPKLYTLDEISTLPVTIVGKVIELRRKF